MAYHRIKECSFVVRSRLGKQDQHVWTCFVAIRQGPLDALKPPGLAFQRLSVFYIGGGGVKRALSPVFSTDRACNSSCFHASGQHLQNPGNCLQIQGSFQLTFFTCVVLRWRAKSLRQKRLCPGNPEPEQLLPVLPGWRWRAGGAPAGAKCIRELVAALANGPCGLLLCGARHAQCVA